MRKGFTLIEVMLSVGIISVVVITLLKLYGTNTQLFSTLDERKRIPLLATFVTDDVNTTQQEDPLQEGEEKLRLDDQVQQFKVDDELRQYLKAQTVKVIDDVVAEYGNADFTEAAEAAAEEGESVTQSSASVVLEVHRMVVVTPEGSAAFVRLGVR